MEPKAARFRLFTATADFLRNASERQPLVLFLDDLHAADAPSLLLLRFLARELARPASSSSAPTGMWIQFLANL